MGQSHLSVESSVDIVRNILLSHGLPDAEPLRATLEGVANAVWFCGSVVVRVCKDIEYLSDSYTEAIASPVAFEAGVLTPRMLAFDDSRTLAPMPYTIFERVKGRSLSQLDTLDDPDQLYASFGRELKKLHNGVHAVNDPLGHLDSPWFTNPHTTVAQHQEAVPEVVQKWLFPFGAEDFDTTCDAKAFVHQDLHPENILVHDGRLAALIDWGDAGWGDPASDFRYVPARFMAAALDAYQSDDPDLERRIWCHVLDQHLYAHVHHKSYGPVCDESWSTIEPFLNRQFRH